MNDETYGSVSAKVAEAIALLQRYDPRRWNRFCRDVDGIWVFGTVGGLGCWLAGVGLVRLNARYVAEDSTSPAEIATTLVHEGTHARLTRCGFGYPEELRPRIEAVCFRSEISFARRLPDPGDLVERAESQLRRDPAIWTTAAFIDQGAADLRDLGLPGWALRPLHRFAKWWHGV